MSLPAEGWLKVFAMKRGVVGIRGVKSGLYLCLGADGLPHGAVRVRYVCATCALRVRYGCEWRWRAEPIEHSPVMSPQEKFSDDCLLKENLEENHYTTYSSATHPGVYLALSHKGEVRRGHGVGPHHSSTHFLPRKKA